MRSRLAALTACIALGGCSGVTMGGSSTSQPGTPPSSTQPSPNTSEPSGSPTISAEPGVTSVTDAPTSSTATGTPPPLLDPATVQNRDLTTQDAFSRVREWRDDRFDVARESQLLGLGVDVATCEQSDVSAPELEFRLANKFAKLSFSAGQSNTSPSSDMVLKIDIIANGTRLDSRRASFNSIQNFDLNITDVNALKIRLYLDPDIEWCSSARVEGVIFRMKLS